MPPAPAVSVYMSSVKGRPAGLRRGLAQANLWGRGIFPFLTDAVLLCVGRHSVVPQPNSNPAMNHKRISHSEMFTHALVKALESPNENDASSYLNWVGFFASKLSDEERAKARAEVLRRVNIMKSMSS